MTDKPCDLTKTVHCWEEGPAETDGTETTCMLLNGHDGPHEWTRDDEVMVSFPAKREVFGR